MRLLNLILFCSIYLNLNAQTTDLEKYNKEKQEILNLILNSNQFDSIYSFKTVYLASNELFSSNTPLILKRKKCKIKVFEKDVLLQKKLPYVTLGSFTLDIMNPTGASVQIYSSSTRSNLNIYLKKNNSHWIIENHKIFED